MSGRQFWESKMKHSGVEVRKNLSPENSVAASSMMEYGHGHLILQDQKQIELSKPPKVPLLMWHTCAGREGAH